MRHLRGASGWRAWTLGVMLGLLGLLWLSGVALFATQTAFASDWTELLLPWRHSMAMLHGILAWCLTLWVGAHVWPHVMRCKDRPMTWRRWVAGWSLLLLLLFLGLSAWALMYGSADGHESVVMAHFWPGLVLPIGMGAHWIGPSLQRRHRRFSDGSIRNPSPRRPARE